MLDLSEFSQELLIARGQYATVRGEHEDKKIELQKLSGQLSAYSAQILRHMQPDNDGVPESPEELLNKAESILVCMRVCVADIASLAEQRSELRKTAWPK